MNWYFFALSFFLMLITPLSLEIRLAFGTNCPPSGYIRLMIWNTGFTAHVNVRRNKNRKLEILERKRTEGDTGSKNKRRLGVFLRAVRTFVRADKARRLLIKTTSFTLMPSVAVLGFQDAAKTAEAVGSVRALRSVLPERIRRSIAVFANFRGECGLQIHCILGTRMGILLCAALMAAGAYRKTGNNRQGAKKWDSLQSGT